MTDLSRWLRALFLVTAIAAIGVYFRTSALHGHIRADITEQTEHRMKQRWDHDGNGILSGAEMRRGLTRIIRGVAGGDETADVNGDGVVNRDDIVESVRIIRAFLLATCGNGHIDAGEQCDDGNTVSGDGCSGTGHPNGACAVEFCGDGFTDADGIPDNEGTPLIRTQEQCDEGGRCQGGAKDGERCTRFGEDPACGEGIPCVTVDTGSCTADCQLSH